MVHDLVRANLLRKQSGEFHRAEVESEEYDGNTDEEDGMERLLQLGSLLLAFI